MTRIIHTLTPFIFSFKHISEKKPASQNNMDKSQIILQYVDVVCWSNAVILYCGSDSMGRGWVVCLPRPDGDPRTGSSYGQPILD